MAMRARAIVPSVPALAQKKRGRHGLACNVISILAKSAAVQEEIDHMLRQPLTDLHRIESCLRYWTAFVQIKCHQAPHEVWSPLCEAINIALLLCEDGIGAEYQGLFIEAQEAIFRASARGYRLGTFRLDGPAISTISQALEVADAQLEVALRGDLARAERTMIERINEGNFFRAEPLAA